MRHLLGILLVLAILLAAAWSTASLLSANSPTPQAGSTAQQFHQQWGRLDLALRLNPANAFYWDQRAKLALTSGTALSPQRREGLAQFSQYQAAALAPSWEVPLLRMANQCSVRRHSAPPRGAGPCRSLYLAVLRRNPTYGYAHYRYADFLYDQATAASPAQIQLIESLCRHYGQSLHLMHSTLRYDPWYRKAEAQAYTRCLALTADYAQARQLKPETGEQWDLMGRGLGKGLGAEGWPQASKLIFRDLKESAAGLDKYEALARGLQTAKAPRAAEEVLRAYLSRFPSDPKAWQDLVDIMIRHKNIFTDAEVMEAIGQAQKQAVSTPEQMIFLAWAARRAGQVETALGILRKAIAADPANPNAFIALGNCLMAAGQTKKAIKAYERAVILSPDSPDCHVYLGLAYARDKQYEAAVKELQRALDLNPQDKKAKAALKKMGIY